MQPRNIYCIKRFFAGTCDGCPTSSLNDYANNTVYEELP